MEKKCACLARSFLRVLLFHPNLSRNIKDTQVYNGHRRLKRRAPGKVTTKRTCASRRGATRHNPESPAGAGATPTIPLLLSASLWGGDHHRSQRENARAEAANEPQKKARAEKTLSRESKDEDDAYDREEETNEQAGDHHTGRREFQCSAGDTATRGKKSLGPGLVKHAAPVVATAHN
ncbi:hypothetical protein MRX96_009298 [Rhipicephalus microplus]